MAEDVPQCTGVVRLIGPHSISDETRRETGGFFLSVTDWAGPSEWGGLVARRCSSQFTQVKRQIFDSMNGHFVAMNHN